MVVRNLIIGYRNQIREYKAKLRMTDYIALKFAEGEITANEYAPTLIERRQYRYEINVLEDKIKTLKGNK